MKKQLAIAIGILLLAALAFFMPRAQEHHEHEHEEEESFLRGPHNGRILESNGFQMEIVLHESQYTPPIFRIYFYEDGKQIDPSQVKFDLKLKRINREEEIPFKVKEGFLESTITIVEPHSFQVDAKAKYKDQKYQWEYDSFEGRVILNQDAIDENKVKIAIAGPREFPFMLNVMGKILPNENHTVAISPRFSGVVKAVHKNLGDFVRKGDVLAAIESNESLQDYEISAPSDGMIIKKAVNLGMSLSGQENIYTISDLNTVWADFTIFRQDISEVNIDDPIKVTSLNGKQEQNGHISYISPIGNEGTQSVIARAVLPNTNGFWKPGLFVNGEILLETVPIEVAVNAKALQRYRDWDVVFIAVGNVFEVVPVEIGRKNGDFVEIISGLPAGSHYVSENSYLLKADLEKAGAEHTH